MKQIAFLTFVAVAFAAGAQAPTQVPQAPAKPVAQESTKPAPAKRATAAAAAAPKKLRRWNEDARHCLERGSTTEIIKCAEEYL